MKKKAKNSYSHTKWLDEFAQDSDDPVVRNSEQMIKYFLELEAKLPDRHDWRHLSSDIIKAEIKSSKSPGDMNRIYWHDIGHSIEAYGITVSWRASELINSAINCLNLHKIISTAVLARSLLELTATFVYNSNNIELNISRALEKIPKRGGTIFCKMDEVFFDKLLDMGLYGTRLDISHAPKIKNVLDIIRSAAKITDQKLLFSIYEFLCELAHPNVIGNACYWGQMDTNIDGTKSVKIGRDVESLIIPEVIEKILWTLSWAGFCICTAYDSILKTKKIIMEKWPITPIGS